MTALAKFPFLYHNYYNMQNGFVLVFYKGNSILAWAERVGCRFPFQRLVDVPGHVAIVIYYKGFAWALEAVWPRVHRIQPAELAYNRPGVMKVIRLKLSPAAALRTLRAAAAELGKLYSTRAIIDDVLGRICIDWALAWRKLWPVPSKKYTCSSLGLYLMQVAGFSTPDDLISMDPNDLEACAEANLQLQSTLEANSRSDAKTPDPAS
jgi:hypothetical protein